MRASWSRRTRAQKVALVQQESALLFPLRVWEFVLQGRYPYGRRLRFESEEDCLMAGNALAQVGATDLRDRWMEQLSGGEKQRVILARALAQQPSLLLLDEPTQHLDIGGKLELLRRLRRLADENRYTVVVVTHELNLASEFSDRILLLHRGKALACGAPAEVYRREILEPVFDAPLDVEIAPSGRPRVMLREANGGAVGAEELRGWDRRLFFRGVRNFKFEISDLKWKRKRKALASWQSWQELRRWAEQAPPLRRGDVGPVEFEI